MLQVLTITDFALIDHLELSLEPGLNVLTGETGAGKSIIVDAIGLLLGERAEEESIRAEATQAKVEGLFSLSKATTKTVAPILEEAGLTIDDGEIVVVREINHQGRNVCRVNGSIVPLKVLATIGEYLVDIHGQSQHLSLLNVKEHLEILDRYAGLGDLRGKIAAGVRRITAARNELAALQGDAQEMARRVDLLQYQHQEIMGVKLLPGEDDALEAEQHLAGNSERLQQQSDDAYRALYDADGSGVSAIDQLGAVAQDTANLAGLDPSLTDMKDAAESLVIQAQELAHALQTYRDGVEHSPQRLEEIEERLEVIRQLKRKYGDTIDDVLAFAEDAAAQLEGISNSDERSEALEAEILSLLAEVGTLSKELSGARSEAATRLAQAVEGELAELAMETTTFRVGVTQETSEDGLLVIADDGSETWIAFDSTGIDHVEFLLSPGPGEPLRSLAATASGGEASRLMLAIKGVLTAADQTPTLVFDEVDAGIGGRVGTVVGDKTWRLSANHQVVCVTHLPQIAAFADHHVHIEKSVVKGRTVTSTQTLSPEGMVEEISNMLGSASAITRSHAKEMLEQTSQWKKGQGKNNGASGLETLQLHLLDTPGESN
jgi:DNA repair protein RecN (Recombination protein N)